MYEEIQKTASWLKERMTTNPKTAIILGTGLGQLASEITDSYEFPCRQLKAMRESSSLESWAEKILWPWREDFIFMKATT